MSFTRKLEVSANIAILVVGIAILFVLSVQWRQRTRSSGIPTGSHIKLANLDKRAPLNLVLGLSTGCHYCTESAPFYQTLIQKVAPEKVHVIATFPQPVDQGRTYLRDKSIPVSDVRQVSSDILPIRGTPTLLVVDSSGLVKGSWEGKLDSYGEASVTKLLSQQ